MQISIFKTLYANLKLLPFNQAIRLPIVIGRHTALNLSGGVQIEGSVKPAMILFGIGGSPDLIYYESKKNYLGIRSGAKIVFKGSAQFATHTSVLAAGNELVFGDKFSSNNGCKFSCVEGISFGGDCLLGGNVVVRDSDGHTINEGNVVHPNTGKVKIGSHVWIANNVKVLKGITIADGAVIGYGSLVVKDALEENSIYAGHPAKLVKHGIEWEH